VKWKFPTDSGVYTPPAIDGAGNLYFCSLAGVAYSLTPSGTQRWKFTTGQQLQLGTALSADGTTLYYGAYDAKLRAIDTGRGSLPLGFCTRRRGPRELTAAVDARGVVYVGCYDQKIYGVNANGTLNGTWATGAFIRSSPAISGTTLYCGATTATSTRLTWEPAAPPAPGRNTAPTRGGWGGSPPTPSSPSSPHPRPRPPSWVIRRS
jgi:outer membrane protein assembly factor BamB